MRILMINWAPLWLGAEVGGGVNVYAQNMAIALVKRGHSVYSLSSGYAYNLAGSAYLKRGPDYQGVINYEIINAPNISPGYLLKPTPAVDINEPQSEALLQKVLDELKPDVVHFNNIEGFSAHGIELAKQSGARVIFSLHNYHPICNQVYMLHQDQRICHDFQQGARCVNCFHPPKRSREILKRRLAYHIHLYPEGHLFWQPIHLLKNSLKISLLWLKMARSVVGIWREKARLQSQNLSTMQGLADPSQKPQDEPDNFVLSAPTAAEITQGKAYAERRQALVAAINQADLVLAVSSWVAKVYADHGVDKTKLKTCHIGNKVAEIGIKNPLKHQNRKENAPLRLVYIGLASQPKGFPFFLKTLLNLPKAQTRKLELSIYAKGVYHYNHLLDELSPHLAKLSLQDGFNHADLPKLLKNQDIGIVPPIWWDNAPQVVFEMLALNIPILGARIGGIPDFVQHEQNGLLFEPNDSNDLSTQLIKLITQPQLSQTLRAGIRPMKTIAEHVDELEAFYKKP